MGFENRFNVTRVDGNGIVVFTLPVSDFPPQLMAVTLLFTQVIPAARQQSPSNAVIIAGWAISTRKEMAKLLRFSQSMETEETKKRNSCILRGHTNLFLNNILKHLLVKKAIHFSS
eukprot:NODE_994_length_2441_cov_0.146456.p3 type:complete len:116 gc:universal NODE_994_length_2441_cov_0.146456:496-149(-)